MENKKNNRPHLLRALASFSNQYVDEIDKTNFDNFVDHIIKKHLDIDYLNRPLETIFWNIYGLYRFVRVFDSEIAFDGIYRGQLMGFNPDPHEDGWVSDHSIIYVNQLDKPFLVDSLRIALNARGEKINSLRSAPLWIKRNKQGLIVSMANENTSDASLEALITIEIERCDDNELKALSKQLVSVLSDVELVVNDFREVRQDLRSLIDDIQLLAPKTSDRDECAEFLEWMESGAFVFLGSIQFEQQDRGDETFLTEMVNTRKGLFKRLSPVTRERRLKELSDGVRAFYETDQILSFGKSSCRSSVHRSAYSHYVIVKRFDESGKSIGEARFLGLHTSQFYDYSSGRIPILRSKVDYLLENSGFQKGSHDHKALCAIAESFPRDELLQMPKDALLDMAIGIWQIYQRNMTKVFTYSDPYKKFVSCLIFLPRASFSSRVRERIQRAIERFLGASDSTFVSFFLPESMLVRIYMVFPIKDFNFETDHSGRLEEIVEGITANWVDEFNSLAVEEIGEQSGLTISKKYATGFSEAYKEQYKPVHALRDISVLESLAGSRKLAVDLRPLEKDLQLKLFHAKDPIALSSMIPILENLGFNVLMERPHEITPRQQSSVWLQDFLLELTLDIKIDFYSIAEDFSQALEAIWSGAAENDRFNRLVIGASLSWREVALLRLYSRYLKQLGFSFSQDFIADTLSAHLGLSKALFKLFATLFAPHLADGKEQDNELEDLRQDIENNLKGVLDISHDNVFRAYLQLIDATKRTNYYQVQSGGLHKTFMSIKVATEKICIAPEPRPESEIFVYCPEFEGVHLRMGKVSRGGLRWSDRREDYRKEVLGLVKAQQVKNAVIVPSGAKGGFVIRNSSYGERHGSLAEVGKATYKLFIQALLDITDNYIAGAVVAPDNLTRADGDDPYLVVAADKGTAAFSDLANDISNHHHFWLGDAFASGGSNGYDHKAMGITARGAWVAVKRHFRELGRDIKNHNFSVVGIGDMSGDVFGNGMLLSRQIQLVAAFNHLHIFIDPNPDAEKTYKERERLFNKPHSGWDDFDRSLLSSGARVFSRKSKTLELTQGIKQRFDIDADHATPAELITALLLARVDLLWNGGIGTYVKSSRESDAQVGDKTNDELRVDGRDLRCKVLGEGGNLGITQLGRVEYSLAGGFCNTDFIDNAAGVDCSDHEVNIKILLNSRLRSGDLNIVARNELLASMTKPVAEKVLKNNARQTQAISIALHRSREQHTEYQRFMLWLESMGRLDRDLEFLPTNDQLEERFSERGNPWTRPELAVLISYSKVMLKETLLDAKLLNDAWLADSVEKAFPRMLVEYLGGTVSSHQLANEIAATQLANDLVDRFGFTFVFSIIETVGGGPGEVVRALTVVVNVLGIDQLWHLIETDDDNLSPELQLDLFHILIKVVRRSTSWFLRYRSADFDCAESIELFAEPMQHLLENWDQLRPNRWPAEPLANASLSDVSATSIAGMQILSDNLFRALGIIDLALHYNWPVQLVAQVYSLVGEKLILDDLIKKIAGTEKVGRWQDLASEAAMNQLEHYRCQTTALLLQIWEGKSEEISELWQSAQAATITSWEIMMSEVRKSEGNHDPVITVALYEFLNLVEGLRRIFRERSSINSGS
ncbi:MAG: NAD-glutamate dehydrogenase [Cellvibrionales bacterium TMED148]|nr:NAD-glutamate dehydrogenase [Porticoccaceae bacterium]RPG91880.1 MAG: NAD-glutamate dehydrogenase [Cellvibrionales bacterium TMED148]